MSHTVFCSPNLLSQHYLLTATTKLVFTAYIFFCNDIRARITEENKDLKMTELSKLMGLEWKKLDDEGKQVREVVAQ